MTDINCVIEKLWRPFIQDFSKGGPVYFCFHHEMLDVLLHEEETGSSGVEVMLHHARSCLEVDGSDVQLTVDALAPKQGNFSAAILLACQQILAVGTMANDENGFSEHAYFPRLRSLISPTLPALRCNPYSFADFQRIWRRLETEIRSIEGTSTDSVTFQFGVEFGINKARSFPLSQALLSREDCLVLISRIGNQNLIQLDSESLWALIKANRTTLHRRARQIIGLPSFKERVIDQIRACAARFCPNDIAASLADAADGEGIQLRICKESLDWLNEVFRPYLFRPDNFESITDEHMIQNYLIKGLSSAGFLILPPGSFGDYWVKQSTLTEVMQGEIVLIIGSELEINRAVKIMQSVLQRTLQGLLKKALPRVRGVYVLEVVIPLDFRGVIRIKGGKLLEVGRIPLSGLAHWVGGICIDKRSNKYLQKFLPTSIITSRGSMDVSRVIAINKKGMSWPYFCGIVNSLEEDTSFDIEFPDSVSAILSIGVCRAKSPERYGFLFERSGKLSVELVPVQDPNVALVGYCVDEAMIAATTQVSAGASALFLSELIKGQSEVLTAADRDSILSGIKSSKVPADVKSVICQLLKR